VVAVVAVDVFFVHFGHVVLIGEFVVSSESGEV
jgi:hypothetical protein